MHVIHDQVCHQIGGRSSSDMPKLSEIAEE